MMTAVSTMANQPGGGRRKRQIVILSQSLYINIQRCISQTQQNLIMFIYCKSTIYFHQHNNMIYVFTSI